MFIQQTLNWATLKLKNKNNKTSFLDAEVLLSFVLKKSKEFLYTHPKIELTALQIKKFKKIIYRRAKLEPVAYLTNHKEFYGLDFYVDKRVLIPRPETEILVEKITRYINQSRRRQSCCRCEQDSQLRDNKLTITDIGTGSGCIAIAFKKNLPTAEVYATDISAAALAVAKKNAQRHRVKINFFRGDLLKPLARKRIDIVVANLPYLAKKWIKDKSVKFEPPKALLAGKNGLAIYEKLFKQIINLKSSPLIVIEVDPRNALMAKKLAQKYFPNSQIEIKKDLAGLNRILIIKKEVHGN